MKALVIVDCTKDFTENGKLPVAGGDQCCADISQYVKERGHHYDVILATKCAHPANWREMPDFKHFSDTPDYIDTWPEHGVEGTDGFEFDENLIVVFDRTHVFYKGRTSAAYSGFEGTNENGVTLAAFLRDAGVDEIDVVGLTWDYCDKATALGGIEEGFKVNIIKDLTASVHPENDAQVLQELVDAGVTVWKP